MWKFYHAFVLNRLVVPTPSSKKDVAEKRRLSQKKSAEIHSEDSDRRESRVMTTSTNSVLIGGAGPGAPMAPAVAVKPMSVDEKNRAIRARAVAEAKK